MKAKLIILTLIILTGTICFVLGRHLYYFGESYFSFYKLLPLKIKPENRTDIEGGFALSDEYEMTLVGNGVRYWQVDSITIDKIVAYGFNSDLLISRIIDTKGDLYYFEFTENRNPEYTPDISVRLIYEDEISTLDHLKWIDNNVDDDLGEIILFRNWLTLVFIGLFIVLNVLLFRKNKPQLPIK